MLERLDASNGKVDFRAWEPGRCFKMAKPP